MNTDTHRAITFRTRGGTDIEDDFDDLLASSSLGSPQALAIRTGTPGAASECFARLAAGSESGEPDKICDIDDAVSGLVRGLVLYPGSSASWTAEPLDIACLFDGLSRDPWWTTDLWATTAWEWKLKADSPLLCSRGWTHRVIVSACRAENPMGSMRRTALLQALVDCDAVGDLRPQVAWDIVDTAFAASSRPQVLAQVLWLVVDQVDVAEQIVPYLRTALGRRQTNFLHLPRAAMPPTAPLPARRPTPNLLPRGDADPEPPRHRSRPGPPVRNAGAWAAAALSAVAVAGAVAPRLAELIAAAGAVVWSVASGK